MEIPLVFKGLNILYWWHWSIIANARAIEKATTSKSKVPIFSI